jgi:hypothetical protein
VRIEASRADLLAQPLACLRICVLREPKENILSPDGRAFVVAAWEFAAFIANSLVFLLIGLSLLP